MEFKVQDCVKKLGVIHPLSSANFIHTQYYQNREFAYRDLGLRMSLCNKLGVGGLV